MPMICYQPRKFSADSQEVIDSANTIVAAYQAQGYQLTLRQLYYQFVARDLLANTTQNYKRLGSIVNDARLAGLIDWDAIEDRTRNLHELPDWSSPANLVRACAQQFRLDKWAGQDCRIEVWIEKEALAGVFERVCDELQVPFFACRGYTSQSEMWVAGQRLKSYLRSGKDAVILHFGDHDPSGMDMSRDITDRLTLFMGGAEFHRLALNMDQVAEHQPPPNPAKVTDSRFAVYQAEYGEESWELDALEPDLLAGLVRDFVLGRRDESLWEEAVAREEEGKRQLGMVASQWSTIVHGLPAPEDEEG